MAFFSKKYLPLHSQIQTAFIMETGKLKTGNKTEKQETAKKELSQAGKWFRDHPNRKENVIIHDRRILYGLSPFDPDYHLTPQ